MARLIYALLDPTSREVRYIGKTVSGMKRARSHLWPSTYLKCDSYKDRWVRKIVASGNKPVLCVLASGFQSDDELLSAEIDYIALYKTLGARLTNTSLGGETGPGLTGSSHPMYGRKPSDELLARLRTARLGMKHTDEIKQICGAAARRKHSPEHIAKRVAKKSIPVALVNDSGETIAIFPSHQAASDAGYGSFGGLAKASRNETTLFGKRWKRLA